MDPSSALSRIQPSLRAAASKGRDVARLGPFHATVSPHSANPYVNYAIPDADAEPTPDAVATLVAHFRERGRKPRLEYVPDLAPRVEAVLIAAGFAVEARTPLMVLDRPLDVPAPEGVEFHEPRDDAEFLALLGVLHEAFGDDPPTHDDAIRQRERTEAGGIALLACLGGDPAGGGLVSAPEDGLAEIGGVAVRPAYRRRGIAAAVVARLTELALARGVDLPFLMAATADEARLYARVGYMNVSEVLHISCESSMTGHNDRHEDD